MNKSINRRTFLKSSAALAGALTLGADTLVHAAEPRFKISVAQWSLHRALLNGELDNLDFPKVVREQCGLDAVEWVNTFFHEPNQSLGRQPKNQAYLNELKKRTDDQGVQSLLIMCDGVGRLGDPDKTKRSNAVKGHYAWLEAAKFLGCHSIRVNAASDQSLGSEEQQKLCIDGLRSLSEIAAPHGLNVIVENHGGLSSNGAWLASTIKGVGMDNCGTLPDFGNFYVARNRGNAAQYEKAKAPYKDDPVYKEDEIGLAYDRYQGVTDLMPYAKGVSAKSHDFDAQGNEIHTDYTRMMKTITDAGYSGYIGIEYEGSNVSEEDGVLLTKALLEKVIQ